jgi:hypothetical protein
MSLFRPPLPPVDPNNLRPGEGCPWHEWRETYGEPNINWCERNVCGWIEQPSTAYTNASYLLLGAVAILQARTRKDNPKVAAIGWAIVFTGLVSFWYHASNNWLTQIFDFLGMYTYSGLLILMNLERLHQLGDKWGRAYSQVQFWARYVALLVLNILILLLFHYVLGSKIQWTFFINILAILALEYRIYRQNKNYDLQFLKWTVIVIAVAQACSLMDVNRIYCEPDNVFIHGHALWHVLGGLASYLSYRFYRQFKFV